MTSTLGLFAVPWGHYVPALVHAGERTLMFTALGFVGAVVIGLVIALARISPILPLRLLARLYVEIFRNLPLITELFIVYFGLATVGVRLSVLVAGSFSLAVFYGAYLSEIFRAGLEGVHKGQREAAYALGLSVPQTFTHISVPLATRLALPGTSTMLVDLLKGTSLMVTIGGAELMTEGQLIVSDTFRPLEVYAVIGAIYVALALPLSQASLMLERALKRGVALSPGRRRIQRHVRRSGPAAAARVASSVSKAAAEPGVPVIVVENLGKSYGSRVALESASITIRAGEVVSIVGKSGSGKSTLLRCLNLLERPTAGDIRIGEQPLVADGSVLLRGSSLVKLRRRLGMVFQHLYLFPHLTAAENIALPLVRGTGVDERTAVETAMYFLARVGLEDRALDLPDNLSGGQQQRVAIARALALRPIALLFDEPTSALDPESTAEVLTVMRELRDEGMTMVIVTHELAFAREASDRIGFMDAGRFIEIGTPDQVLRTPVQARTREFVDQYAFN